MMYNLKVLLYLDFLKIKNFFLETFKSPIQIIKRSLGLLYFLFIGFICIKSPVKEIKAPIKITPEIYNTALGIISVLGTIIVISVLIYYFSNYTPINFIISDIQYLFPSPISNSLILLYSLIKSSIKGVLAFLLFIIFFVFILISTFGVSIIKVFAMLLGSFFVFLFFMSLAYLIFSFRVKFNLDKSFKILSHALKVVLVGFVLLIIYTFWNNNFSILQTFSLLGSSILIKIPVICNIVNIISVIMDKGIYPQIYDIVILLALVFINILIFFKLNINYYEYIAEKVEEKDQKIKEALQSKDITLNTQIEKKLKKVNTSLVSKEYYGVLALFWKNSTVRKRRSTSIKKYLVYLINFGVSIAGAYGTIKGHQKESIFIIAGVTMYSLLIASASSELSRELKSLYIFLIPGKPIFKILSSILDELITLFIRVTIMLLPSIVLNTKFLALGLLVYILTLLVCFFLKLENLITVLLLPKEKTSPPMLYMLFIMLIVAVPVGIAGFIFFLTSNMYIAIASALAVIICYIIVISLLCEFLFKKIQY